MTQPNIFQEVQEDLERQRMEALWRRYAPVVMTAAFLIIAGTATYTAYDQWKANKQQTATASLFSLFSEYKQDKTKLDQALLDFANANPRTSQAVFARLNAASGAAEMGDNAKAIGLYDAIAADTKIETAFRQYADLMSVRLQMADGDAKVMIARLEPLTMSDGAWRYSALELVGHLALKMGDKAKAKEVFASYANSAEAPKTLAERAADMVRYLSE